MSRAWTASRLGLAGSLPFPTDINYLNITPSYHAVYREFQVAPGRRAGDEVLFGDEAHVAP